MTSIDLEPVRPYVEILRYVKQKKAELNELEANARGAVEERMGEAENGLLDGESAIRWDHHKRRSLDQKSLREAHPDVVEEYMTVAEIRRFEVLDDSH